MAKRASELHRRFPERQSPRPVIVEFAGTPKSGKTTCIEAVRHFFHRLDFKVFAPAEGVSKRIPPQLKKDLLYFNTWAGCYALMQMFEAAFHSDNYHVVILDRGIFDFLAWIEWLCARREPTGFGEKQPMERMLRDSIQSFAVLPPWTDLVDLVVLFRCDAKTSLDRENKWKLVEKGGRAMNPSTLTELFQAYETTFERYRRHFGSFIRFETTEGRNSPKPPDLHTIACSIVEHTLAVMETNLEANAGPKSGGTSG